MFRLIAIGIIALTILGGLTLLNFGDENTQIDQSPPRDTNFDAQDSQGSPDLIEGTPTGISGSAQSSSEDSGSSSGSSGGSSGSSSSTSQGCYTQQISYALEDFTTNSTCLDYSLGNCVEKMVDCSINVTNLDDSTSGNFIITFFVLKQGDDKEDAINSESIEQHLNPGETTQLANSFEIEGSNANLNLVCSFETTAVPRKQICN